MNLIDQIEAGELKKKAPEVRIGDTVKAHIRIIEGEKERVQVFEGVVIRLHGGAVRETMTLRKISFGVGVERRSDATDFFLESAELRLGKQEIGELGQLQPTLGRGCECRQPVFLAELDMDLLLQRRTRTKSFKALPQFPSIVRDVAMVVPESTTHAKVLGVVKKAKPANLMDLRLFDVFRGGNVAAGQKSVAYTFTYRHGEKTLTDEEVNGAHEELVETLREQLSAVIRDT